MEKGRIMAYIKVENLKYRYPNTTKLALDGLDFEIEKGLLLGSSGRTEPEKYALSGFQRSCSGIFQRGLWRKSSDRGH